MGTHRRLGTGNQKENRTENLTMESAVYVSAFAMVTAIFAPWLMASQLNRNARKVKEEDYKRQDEVAARVEQIAGRTNAKQDESARLAQEAARLLLIHNIKADEAAERAEASAAVRDAKLDQIHTLVNSNLTAALKDQLDARKAMLALLLETVGTKKEIGAEPSADMMALIDDAQKKVAELEAVMLDRLKQTDMATARLEIDLKLSHVEPAAPDVKTSQR